MLVTDLLVEVLMISVTFSIFQMSLVQKVKALPILKKSWQVLLFNFLSSLILGPFFSLCFFEINLYNSFWVSLFGFVGAPSIYEMLKNQSMINYKPKTLNEIISASKEKEIKK